MAPYRPESVGRSIQVELSKILRHESRDPRLENITVTGVTMSKDLRTAKIFISVLHDRRDEVLEGLASANAFLRREVAQLVRLRNAPELFFSFDESLEHGSRIDQLLNKLDT